MVILISLLAVITTLCGGIFALRFKDKLHLVLGFSAGAVLGVAFFDLLPEALSLGAATYEISTITTFVAFGFLLYMLIDRNVSLHAHEHEEGEAHLHRGRIGAGSFVVHSFLDGMAIGLAFQVSPTVGAVVATAVLVHDFSDGINTVNIILKNKGSIKNARRWLAMGAIAPALGATSTLFFTLHEATLAIVLSMFCGFFLYIGASDLLPESHHAHPTRWTTLATVLGVATLYFAIHLAGG